MQIIPPVYAEVDIRTTQIAKYGSIGTFTNVLVPLFMTVGALMTLAMFLYGAYMYLTSEGNPDKIKKAQAVFTYSIIGLILIISSFIITKVIGVVLNVKMPL